MFYNSQVLLNGTLQQHNCLTEICLQNIQPLAWSSRVTGSRSEGACKVICILPDMNTLLYVDQRQALLKSADKCINTQTNNKKKKRPSKRSILYNIITLTQPTPN